MNDIDKELILGIDLGTSYFKMGLFDYQGRLRGLGRVAVLTERKRDCLCQLQVVDFWKALRQGLQLALNQAGSEIGDIRAISYSSQANSFLLLDCRDQPLTPFILWPDQRVWEVDPRLQQLRQEEPFYTTGLGIKITEEFALPKILWIQKQQPEIWFKTTRIMTISDYLTYSLTGQMVGDEATIAMLGLRNIRDHQWCDKIFTSMGMNPSQWVVPLRPGTMIGPVITPGAKYLGIPAGIPYIAGSLDHYMAAIGGGLGTHAQASESTGTVLAFLRFSQRYQYLETICCGPGNSEEYPYYLMAFDGNGAVTLEWYQRHYAAEIPLPELIQQAEGLPDDNEGLIALPNAGQYPGLTGFRNQSGRHHHGHFIRAIMESTITSLAELIHQLFPGEKPDTIVATGGGARSDLWLAIKAKRLGIDFIATKCPEPACLGAAMTAAIVLQLFPNLKEAQSHWCRVRRVFSATEPFLK
jgi:sugar (pentulose or hexulose) kinase